LQSDDTNMKRKRKTITPYLLLVFLVVMFCTNSDFRGIFAQTDTSQHVTDSTQNAVHETAVEPVSHEPVSHEDADHADEESSMKEIVVVLFGLIVIIAAAKLGGEIAERLHQPAVLGELLLGVVIGNLVLFNVHALEFIKHHEFIELIAEIGVLILLFEVGLENNLSEMMSVGTSAFLVATAGVIAPFILGWGVAAIFLADQSTVRVY